MVSGLTPFFAIISTVCGVPPAHHKFALRSLFRLGTQTQAMDLVELAVEVALPGGQQLPEHLQRFVEPAPRLVLIDAQAGIFTPSEAASDAADDVAARLPGTHRAC